MGTYDQLPGLEHLYEIAGEWGHVLVHGPAPIVIDET
jgi:hypothetical protein